MWAELEAGVVGDPHAAAPGSEWGMKALRVPTFFVDRSFPLEPSLRRHPARVEQEDEAVLSMVCCFSVESAAKLQTLKRRTPQRPYVVWSHGFTIEQCVEDELQRLKKKKHKALDLLASRCGTGLKLISERNDFLYLNYDLRDYWLRNDNAALLPGITLAPPGFWLGSPANLSRQPKYFLTFRGGPNMGWFGSSQARRNLDEAFRDLGRSDVVYELIQGHDIRHSDEARFRMLMDTAYALLPHGDGRWTFRFSEAIGACAIPVLIADGLTLPFEELIDWSRASVRINESRIRTAKEILDQLPSSLSVINDMRKRVCKINQLYFSSMERRVDAMLLSLKVKLSRGAP